MKAASERPSPNDSASANPLTAETKSPTSGLESKHADPLIAPSVKASQILKYSFIFIIPYTYLLCFHYKIDASLKQSILINAVFSVAGFIATLYLIPVASRKLLKRNICGLDINKKGTPQGSAKVPESLGSVVGVVSFVAIVLFEYFNFKSGSKWLEEYDGALISVCFMLVLGFGDDVLDVPWRVKLLLPSIASLPLLKAYTGPTTVIVPKPLNRYIGVELQLGCIYKLYMWLFTIFCTNSINIHAGINGLEVGQSVVIACSILIHNVMQIGVASDFDYKQGHALSIYFVQPLLATSLALLSFNWYPSSVFVGDSYTYFAGMTLAVAGILGHFSETLLMFFLPQILNFLLSLPQLSGYIPCPRHRLPRFDPQTGLLTGTDDGNLVNFFLRRFGEMSERSLCVVLLVFQAICCGFCFWLRWYLAGWYK